MTKHKTSELTGALLDAAVAKAEGIDFAKANESCSLAARCANVEIADRWSPSCDWDIGGPIIEREGIELHCIDRNGRRMGEWLARHPARLLPLAFGPLPLIAAMRAYVASMFGDEVDLPEEAMKG